MEPDAQHSHDHNIQPFLHLDFIGGEFDREHGGLRFSDVAALAHLRSAIEAIARRLYRIENPERRRVGGDFDAGFDLVMSTFGPGGSRLGNIARTQTRENSDAERSRGAEDYHEKARRILIESLVAANNGAALDSQHEAVVRSDAITHVIKLNEKMCRPGESIRLLEPGEPNRIHTNPNLNARTHAQLLKWKSTQNAKGFQQKLILVGLVQKVDLQRGEVTISSNESGKNALLPFADREMVVEALSTGACLRVLVEEEVNFLDQHKMYKAVLMASVAKGPSVDQRIEELEKLVAEDPAYFSYGALPKVLVARAKSLIWDMVAHLHLDRPYIYLSPDLSIHIEWDISNAELGVALQHRPGGVAVEAWLVGAGEPQELTTKGRIPANADEDVFLQVQRWAEEALSRAQLLDPRVGEMAASLKMGEVKHA